eukprot:366551-Chlamydomonas_euryale.AAC.47
MQACMRPGECKRACGQVRPAWNAGTGSSAGMPHGAHGTTARAHVHPEACMSATLATAPCPRPRPPR